MVDTSIHMATSSRPSFPYILRLNYLEPVEHALGPPATRDARHPRHHNWSCGLPFPPIIHTLNLIHIRHQQTLAQSPPYIGDFLLITRNRVPHRFHPRIRHS